MPEENTAAEPQVNLGRDAAPEKGAGVAIDDPHALRGRSSRQYMLSLRSAFILIMTKYKRNVSLHPSESNLAAPPPEYDVVNELKSIFARYEGRNVDWNTARVWDDAFACERLMIDILDADALMVELDRRTLEMRAVNPSLSEFYSGRVKSATDDATELTEAQVNLNRTLLRRLTRDIQWEYGQNDLRRRYAREAQVRVVYTFIGSLAFFAFVMFWTFNFVQLKASEVAATGAATQEEQP